MLLSNETLDVPVDGSANDLFPCILGRLHVLFRVEHVVDLGLILHVPRVCWLLLVRWIALVGHLHVHHLLGRDLTHLVLVDVLSRDDWHGFVPAVAVRSALVLLLGLDWSVDGLLELLTSCWHVVAPLPIMVAVHAQLVHDDAKRSDQLEEIVVLGAHDVELVLLVSLLVHLLFIVEPPLLFGLTVVCIERATFEEHLRGGLL